MNRWDTFLDHVRNGRIEGLYTTFDGGIDTPSMHLPSRVLLAQYSDHLCAHIRRWLTGKGLGWCLLSCGFSLDRGEHFKEGSELDWHIDAANWACMSPLAVTQGRMGGFE
jgi:hypothetical protein